MNTSIAAIITMMFRKMNTSKSTTITMKRTKTNTSIAAIITMMRKKKTNTSIVAIITMMRTKTNMSIIMSTTKTVPAAVTIMTTTITIMPMKSSPAGALKLLQPTRQKRLRAS